MTTKVVAINDFNVLEKLWTVEILNKTWENSHNDAVLPGLSAETACWIFRLDSEFQLNFKRAARCLFIQRSVGQVRYHSYRNYAQGTLLYLAYYPSRCVSHFSQPLQTILSV
jgi:hypothetical protein